MRRCEDKTLLILWPSHTTQRQDMSVLRSGFEVGREASFPHDFTRCTSTDSDGRGVPSPPLPPLCIQAEVGGIISPASYYKTGN